MYFNNHTFINKDTFITKLLRSAVLVMALVVRRIFHKTNSLDANNLMELKG